MEENNKMQRGALFCLWILFTFSLFAQNEENGSVACDTAMHKNTFGKALKKFLNFSDFDTTYISPNRYNYALMLDHFTNYEYYSVGNDGQRLRFSPNPHNKIGAYFGWRWIFLGWAVDTDWLYGKKSKKKRGTEFDLSLYSSKLGVDIFYRSTGNDYKIHKVSGFSDEIPSNYSEDFNGLKVKMKGLNMYYIFNNQRFSYPAAFSQSTNQRRNAGSFIHPELGPLLHVLGADLMDGTPILDIKPYLPFADCIPDASDGFSGQVFDHNLDVLIPPEWEAVLPPSYLSPLRQTLSQDPRPSYQDDPDRIYGLTYGGFDIKFRVKINVLTVCSIQPV